MPGISAEYKPNDKSVVELAAKERKSRCDVIDAAWKYYRDGGIRKPLKVRPGQPDDNIMLPFSSMAIDRLVSFFAPKPPRFKIETGEDETQNKSDPPEQKAIDAFLKANEFDHQIVDIALSGFLAGHNFMRLFPPDNLEPMSESNTPRMALLDPRKVNVFWDVSDIQRVLWYRLTWSVTDDVYRRQDIVPTWLEKRATTADQKPDLALGWEIIEYEGKGETVDYKEVSRDHWPYQCFPIYQWKNKHAPHEFFGETDLIHADLNDSINFIASNTARIIKFHAHPKTIVTGTDSAVLKTTTVDGIYTLPDGSTITNLEMKVGSLSASLDMLNLLSNRFMGQMHVVDISTVKDQLGQITNFGVRMLFKDMLDVTTMKRSLYGNGLAQLIQGALVMMGFADAPKPVDQWDDPLPSDRQAVVNAAAIEQKLGTTSTKTLAEDLGRDYDKEQAQKQTEGASGADQLAGILTNINQRGLGQLPMLGSGNGRPGAFG